MGTNGNGNAPQNLLTTNLPSTDGLSDQQRTFVVEYLHTGNASEAARIAGYAWPAQTAWHLLKTARIRRVIDETLALRKISEPHVLAELSELAFINMGDFISENGDVDLNAVRKRGHLVKKYRCRRNKRLSDDQVTVEDVEIELHDRHSALVDIGKKYKMFGSDSVIIVQFVQNFFPALKEAMEKWVPEEHRLEMLDYLEKKVT